MFYDDNEIDQEVSEVPVIHSKPITIDEPGQRVDLPIYVIKELQDFWPNYRKRLPFFGGHPASITKHSCNDIFTQLNFQRQSPYLVCEKTDGVRYLLIVARVYKEDAFQFKQINEHNLALQCYLVSRQGQGKLVAYVADIGISSQFEPASKQQQGGRKHIVEVLDGQLVSERGEMPRYLIFDALIHLGRDICPVGLRERLDSIASFVRCNEMLGFKITHNTIEIRMKDFFRLTCRKFNLVEFMLKKYIKCLTHENDGIIFNHQEKEYVLGGTNSAYIKWKPAHLNTVDFMIVPNANLEGKYGKRILDLYLAVQDPQLQRYTRQFYAFTIVSESDFQKINTTYEQALYRINQNAQDEQGPMVINEFAGSIIAECRYETTKLDQRKIMSTLYKLSKEELSKEIMKQGEEDKDQQAVSELKRQIYDQCWKIYKIRQDKSLPNNYEVARKIEESIRDGISEQELIKKNNDLNKLADGR